MKIKGLITILVTLLVMFITNAIFDDKDSTIFLLLEIGSLLTIAGVLISMTFLPIWDFIHAVRIRHHRNRNEIIEQKKWHDKLTKEDKENGE